METEYVVTGFELLFHSRLSRSGDLVLPIWNQRRVQVDDCSSPELFNYSNRDFNLVQTAATQFLEKPRGANSGWTRLQVAK
jgi:hypothetical protein